MKKLLFIPDQHFPYNDKKYWKVLLKVAKRLKFDYIIIFGDFLDCYTISSHSQDPDRKTSLLSEIKSAKKALKELEQVGCNNLIYLEGNHEDRLRRYIIDKAPELYGCVKIEDLLELSERWRFIPYREFITIGEMYMVHDVDHAGRQAMYQSIAAIQDNIIFGHTHRLGVIYQGNAKGKAHVALNIGWGGDISKIEYMKRLKLNREWMLGFGVGYLLPSGVMHTFPVPVINYTAVVEGKVFK